MTGTRSRLQRLAYATLLLGVVGCAGGQSGRRSESLELLAADKVVAIELLTREKHQDVVDVLAPWIGRKTRDPQIYALTAKAQWKLERYGEAVGNYEEALRLDYSAAFVHLELAELLMAQGKTGRALTEFELAVRYAPREALPHYNYGLALHRMGRRDEALAQWKLAYSLAPNDATYTEALGIALTGVDDAAGLRHFERAESLGADHASFRNNFGLLLQRLGEYTRAEVEFRDALAQEPENAAYRRNLALLHMASGAHSSAVPLWEGLFREDPESPVYAIYLARAHLALERHDTAIEILERWIARKEGEEAQGGLAPSGGEGAGRASPARAGEAPRLDEAYEILAMSHRGKRDLDRAESFMRKALGMQPDDVAYLNNYGVILAEGGKIPEARRIWRRVLEIDPGNATAARNLSAHAR